MKEFTMKESFLMDIPLDPFHTALRDFRDNPLAKIIDLENDFCIFIEMMGTEEDEKNDFQIELRRNRDAIVWTLFYHHEDPHHPGRSVNSEPPYYLGDVIVGEFSRDEDEATEEEVSTSNLPVIRKGEQFIVNEMDDCEVMFSLTRVIDSQMLESFIKHTSDVFHAVAEVFEIPVLHQINFNSRIPNEDQQRLLSEIFDYKFSMLGSCTEPSCVNNMHFKKDYLPPHKIIIE